MFVETAFYVGQNRPPATAAPGRQLAQGVKLLGGICHAAPLVRDLGVRAEHDAIPAHGGKHDSHTAILSGQVSWTFRPDTEWTWLEVRCLIDQDNAP
ncbi:hypothetical protein QW131_21555 [Roseibium salinum]|nr:hypothetical protein [Roseibium salinum]